MNDLHSPEIQLVRFRRRVLFAGALVLVCFSLLLARFVWLQVVMHDYYRTRAEDNRIALLPVTPNRGLIVDRKGEVLARNYSAYTLEIQPSRVDNLDRTIDELAAIVHIEARDRKRFRKLMDESRNFDSLPIRTRLNDQEVARFIAQRYRFPGVEVRARLFRQYPNAELASHVLGYMGRINRRDAERIQESDDAANYRGTDHIGKSGLEQHYERELHGLTGVEQVEVTAAGRAVRVLSRTPPQQGNNLRLTLDAGLQRVVETAFGDRRGALVAIEPSTGGVLALVSKPTFDPNLFVDGIDTTSWDALNNSPDHPLLNRAIYSAYPPGSTFKPFMALGALTAGKRTPQFAIADPGHFDFGGHRFRDDKVGGHGSVDMHKSIVVSCNTYYYRLAADWGIDGISNFMGQLGLGSRTGIDIDGESTGVLPSRAWKKKRFKRPDQQKWYAGETISVGIGQGYNAYTMIQLAHATAILAADGVVYRPHVVRQIENSRTGAIQLIEPEPVRRVDLRQADIDVIKRAMEDVNRVGTGARAFAGAPYVAAGKTGTAQAFSLRGGDLKTSKLTERLRDHALFIAYAPADDPKIALAVLVENAGFGSQSAAPIARQVFDYYLLGNLPAGPAPEDTDATDSE
ncbi:penicillin-binding protein 2 [Methyloversatilis sp. XJ19-13]|uniref:penicillin-binding protein 2 n=1 Tax=Methyloversatilis sp. XJ19-13 TaxID=2963430 RepID=UPI00211C1B5F|nr:penicillin-binding protein 2 [Methyloversatilis sp. XJ19-13]MCQ9376130.1 penicillin-binding protein 2 [Methyloversatilis sp. XJ19-13]